MLFTDLERTAASPQAREFLQRARWCSSPPDIDTARTVVALIDRFAASDDFTSAAIGYHASVQSRLRWWQRRRRSWLRIARTEDPVTTVYMTWLVESGTV